ncbi:MAG: hypothetical protein EXS32_16340 [Opitutus sp.]|nr:hypothetical protein [Opitutus sp.]
MKRIILLLAALTAASPAFSQAVPATPKATAPASSANPAVQLDKFEVTDTKNDGLHNKPIFRTDEQAPLAFNVIDRIEIERMGVTNMDEVFRNVTEITNYGTNLQRETVENGVTGGTTYSSSNVNLRNLGAGNTVLLINGRRLTSGASSDISRIPPSSIERIEILSAAAAAIYGGNALGGGINIILRKDISGGETSFNYGASTRGGTAAEYGASVRDSRSFNKGRTSLTLLLSYSHRNKFTMGESSVLQRAYERYGPTSTIRVPNSGNVLAFESIILNANTMFAGMPGYIKADFATGTPGTPLLSGDSSTHPLGIPGAPTAWYAQIPAGQNGNNLTPASFTATAGKFNEKAEWRGNRTVLYVPSDLYGFTATLDHTFIKDKLEAYAEVTIALKRDNYSFPTSLGFPYGLGLTATDPLNPFRTGVTPGFVGVPVRVYYDPRDLPDSSTLQERNGASVTLGVKGQISDRWRWTFDVNGDYARQGSDAYVPVNYLQTFVTRQGLTDLPLPTTPAQIAARAPTSLAVRRAIFNPLADRTVFPTPPADVDRLFAYNRAVVNYQRTAQVNPRLAGTVYDLPAGPLATQLRGEFRTEQTNASQFSPHSADMDAMTGIAPALPATVTRTGSTTKAAAIEAVAPIFGRKWLPGWAQSAQVQSLEVQGSMRRNWTNRGRGGDVTSIAGIVGFRGGVSFRASLSEGLVPLTAVSILASPPFLDTDVSLTDPFRGNTSGAVRIPFYVSGGNPDLRNEFSRTRAVGVILRPRFLGDRFSLTATYSETKRFDAVGAATAVNVLNFPDDFPGRIERAALTPADIGAGYTKGAITKLDLTQINLAQTYIETIDLRSTFRITDRSSRLGEIQLLPAATFTNRFVQQARPHSARINNIATISGTGVNGPIKWKGQTALWWNRAPWSATLTGRFVDKYYTDQTRPTPSIPLASGLDGDHIGSSTIYDLQFSRAFAYGSGQRGLGRWLGGTKWTVNIRNLVDRDPRFRSDPGAGFYSRYEDPRGRFVTFTVAKTY